VTVEVVATCCRQRFVTAVTMPESGSSDAAVLETVRAKAIHVKDHNANLIAAWFFMLVSLRPGKSPGNGAMQSSLYFSSTR
jgi:hypothetical protein